MIRELDTVVLDVDLPEHGLCRGDVGTVVLAHDASGCEWSSRPLRVQRLPSISLARLEKSTDPEVVKLLTLGSFPA